MRVALANASRISVSSQPSTSERPRSAPCATAIGIGAAGAYLVALHVLIVSGALPAVALALVVAPWVAALVALLVRTRAAGRTTVAVAAAASLAGTVAIAAAFFRALATRVDAVLFVENLAFLAWLAALFATSLAAGREPLVTRFARATRGGDMPPVVIVYTRRVTMAWTCLFVALMAASTWLFATRSREAWSLFVNFGIWAAVATGAAVEYGVRRACLRGVRHTSPWSAIREAGRFDPRTADRR